MPSQMWEDPGETSAIEAAKAEMRRKRERAREQVARADEDPEEPREWGDPQAEPGEGEPGAPTPD